MNKKEVSSSFSRVASDQSILRIKGLWRITSSLSGAYTKKRVGEIIVNEGFSLLGAHSGDIILINPDKSFKMIAQKGYEKDFLNTLHKADKKSPLLSSEVIKTGKAFYIEDAKGLDKKYKVAKEFIEMTGSHSAVLLPLIIRNKIIGILQFTFKVPQKFSGEDKLFINTLAYQCAQAFERVIALEDLRKSNRELRNQNRVKDDFISMASHELKTPLTGINLFLDLLTKQLKTEKNNKSTIYLERVFEQVKRLQLLVDDLLDLSRIQKRKLTLHPEEFRLDELIRDLVTEYQLITKSHKIINQDIDKVLVFADKMRIYQVLANFISNAVKYSPEKSRITINLRKEEQYAHISVKDEGIGISKIDQNKIFNRFYQVDTTYRNGSLGLGMGLYISYQIIKAHGGKIWVQSKKGKGSTFYFSLPIKEN